MFTLSSDQESMVRLFRLAHPRAVLTPSSSSGFLKAMGEIYEVVVFTASLSKYADPVLDQLDIHRVVKHRLFRESCYNNKGNYVKVSFDRLYKAFSELMCSDANSHRISPNLVDRWKSASLSITRPHLTSSMSTTLFQSRVGSTIRELPDSSSVFSLCLLTRSLKISQPRH